MSVIEVATEFVDLNKISVEIPEDTTIADLAIYIGDDCITKNSPRKRLRLSRTVSDTVTGPVAGLAEWIIDNWMSILWEIHTPFLKGSLGGGSSEKAVLPGLREAARYWKEFLQESDRAEYDQLNDWWGDYTLHSDWDHQTLPIDESYLEDLADWQHRHILGHPSSNLALPSIAVLPEGRNIVLSVDRLPRELSPSVEFLGPDRESRSPGLFIVSKTDFRSEAKDFVDATIRQAQTSSQFKDWADWLHGRWIAAQTEEANPAKRLECMLGQVAAKRVEDLRSEQPTTAEGLEQLLLDCPVVKDRSELWPAEAIVKTGISEGASSLSSGEIAGWEEVGQESIPPNDADFDQGYRLARIVRKKMALGGSPITELDSVLERLDVKRSDPLETPLFRAAVCAARRKKAYIFPSIKDERMKSHAASRFAIVSALGRLLWESRIATSRPICAAQGDHTMVSQNRRANAFAAEFLLPSEAIWSLDSDSPKLMDLASTYGISPSAARWHAHNVRGRRRERGQF
jgi:hypothetical protein